MFLGHTIQKTKKLLTIAGVLLTTFLQAQNVYTLQRTSAPVRIGNRFVFLADATRQMKLEDAIKSTTFKTTTAEIPGYAVTKDVVWGKIKFTCKQSADWYLVSKTLSFTTITVYQKYGKEQWKTVSYGNNEPETQYALQGRLAVKLNVQPGDTTLLVFKAHGFSPMLFDFKVGTLSQFIKPFHTADIYEGICFGIMIMMLIYNLYLFFTQKQTVYLYYVLYVFCSGIFLVVFSGCFFYLPHSIRLLILFNPVFFSAAFGIFLVLFTLKLFKGFIPRILKISLYVLMAIALADILLGFFGYLYVAFKTIMALGLLLGVLCIATGIAAQYKKHSSAKFYLLGFGAYLGWLAFLILSSRLLSASPDTLAAILTGSMAECVFLSFAQADKLKTFQLEKESAQREVLAQVQKNESLIREQNMVLEQKVNERTAELATKNKEILDSIHYAERIQNTLLAHETILLQNIPEHFIFFKPKDIVSGDFYWGALKNNTFYFAVCDSTGHGVPGAFMSLLNISFLNEAVNENAIDKPNEVFNYVRTHLINSISRDGGRDGMDGILVCFEKKGNDIKMQYSAANNGPLLVRKNEPIELAADKMPVGQGEIKNSFALYETELQKGDMLYLYTDGYADQFGGPKGKKFKHKQLVELLKSVATMPLQEQRSAIDKAFNEWKGNLEQVDDVLMIGIRIL